MGYEISVAVCVKEDLRIERLVAALERQTLHPSRFEVVVVSAGSDRYEHLMGSSGLNLTVVHSDVARHAVQRNIGLDLVDSPLFVSTDADCVPSEAWLADLLVEFARQPPDVVAIGGAIRKYAHTTITQRYGITIDDGQPALNFLPALHLPYVTGANAAYRTEGVRRAGRYDETFYCGEDVDISYRLQLDGGRALVISNAVLFHEDRATLREHFHRFRFYAVDQALLFKKYRPVSGKRFCFCRYPWRRLGEAAQSALAGLPRLLRGDRSGVAVAVTTAIEALGVWTGNIQGSIRHRVVYI